MKHRYITLDGQYGGTGIRDQFEGFIELDEIPISNELKKRISHWLSNYPSAGSGFDIQSNVGLSTHDLEGFELMKMTSNELGPEYKIGYYSDLKTKKLIELEGGRIIEL